MSVQSVVVIDDDRITAELITDALEQQLGVDVYSFNRSKQARDFLLQQTNATVSLIISDQMMPDFNGLDLLQACRQAGLTVPFLLLTSDATRDTVIKARQHGASQFVAKPFAVNNLLDKVRALLPQTA
ncbi:response regulator [Salinimonas lutimaris]|uniref:response regulator n=1 Tax=Salinimonas lutimaris TaxID=914153 RepID=UPI0010C00D82|nr:response regulator [Salinimonas lutimaris]